MLNQRLQLGVSCWIVGLMLADATGSERKSNQLLCCYSYTSGLLHRLKSESFYQISCGLFAIVVTSPSLQPQLHYPRATVRATTLTSSNSMSNNNQQRKKKRNNNNERKNIYNKETRQENIKHKNVQELAVITPGPNCDPNR